MAKNCLSHQKKKKQMKYQVMQEILYGQKLNRQTLKKKI